MFRKIILLLIVLAMIAVNGCYTLNHVVGEGAKSGQTVAERQWYILWGLVPINEVKSKEMAGGATNYTVKSQITPLDFLINIFTSWITVYSQTVEVTK